MKFKYKYDKRLAEFLIDSLNEVIRKNRLGNKIALETNDYYWAVYDLIHKLEEFIAKCG